MKIALQIFFLFFFSLAHSGEIQFKITNRKEAKRAKEELKEWIIKNLSPRLQGLAHPYFLEQSQLPMTFAPNRHYPLDDFPPNRNSDCPFDDINHLVPPHYPFGDFILYPNLMPYAENHLLLISTNQGRPHLTQKEMIYFLPQILQIHDYLGEMTLFFNHYAGNSLEHLHLHLTTEKTFLEKKLSPFIRQPLHTSHTEKIFIDQGPCLKGILLVGNDKKSIGDTAKEIIEEIEGKELLYNFFIFPSHRPLSIFITVRKKNHQDTHFLNSQMADLSVPPNISSFELLAGKLAYRSTPFSEKELTLVDQAVSDICHQTVMNPRTLNLFESI